MGSRHLASSPGWRLFRLAGIPVYVSASYFGSVVLVVVLAAPVVRRIVPGVSPTVAAVASLALALLLGVSVLLHEWGHCVVALRMRVPVLSVRLGLMGGVSELARSPRGPRQEALIAAAGPLVSFAVAAVGYAGALVLPHGTVPWLLLMELAVINALVAAFNFLPALPLDGGRVLRAVVWRLSRRRSTGTFVGVIGGFVVSAGLLGWAALALRAGGRTGWFQASIALAIALSIGLGALAERGPASENEGRKLRRERGRERG